MKKYTLFLIVLTMLLPACQKKAVEQLYQKNKEISQLAEQRDSIINQLEASFDELENTLGIEKNEGDAGQRIKQDIEHLKDMLDNNDRKSKSLQNTIARSRNERTLFSGRVDSLNNALVSKNDQINGLNQNITNLKTQIDTQKVRINRLASFNADQKNKIEDISAKLTTAHYVVGNGKELKEKEIIEKKGGFLGLFGRVDKLNPKFSRDEFETVNIQTDTIIPLQGEKINLVTVHPSDTYKLVDSSNVKMLKITNPDKFWAASKYLVVENR